MTKEVSTIPQNEKSGILSLIEKAVSANADISVISKLMDAQDRYDNKIARRLFDVAMAEASASLPTIMKNRQGHNNKYEDLQSVTEAVRPICAQNGLSFRFKTNQDGNKVSVTCIIAHEGGYSEENTLSAMADTSGNKNAIQAIGSAVTYLMRYTLKAALGLAAAVDDDGAGFGAQKTPPTPPRLLSQEEIETLSAFANENQIDLEKFCKFMKVNSLNEIEGRDFSYSLNMMKKGVEQKKRKEDKK